jgi:tyrosine aminotransferase
MSEIPASKVSMRTRNPIRQIVDNLKVQPNAEKKFISLALGDPTTFGNLKLPDSAVNAVIEQLQGFKANGYGPSTGILPAREAIAKMSSFDGYQLTANDVIIGSGYELLI